MAEQADRQGVEDPAGGPTSPGPADTRATTGRRRRRAKRPGEPRAASPVPPPPAAAPVAPEPSMPPRLEIPRNGLRGRRWHVPEFMASWGLSPTFRVFLFLGGILGVLVFLLYNEYVIREFKAQEQDRVELYALLYGLAVSPEVPEMVSGPIFQKIISNPDISFPVVVTDHRGNILMWKPTPGMPQERDRSPAALAKVRSIMAQMDAANEPVVSYEQSLARGHVVRFGASLILTDAEGEPVVWDGPGLPPSADTTEAARNAVRALAVKHAGVDSVDVPAELSSVLLHHGSRFAIVDYTGRPAAWGGPGLPSRGDTTAAARQRLAGAVQELQLAGRAHPFRIRTEKYIHYGNSDLIGRISLAPMVSVGALLLFALVGYMGFRNLRRSEQRSIWVGMAKETAHQLGTPLSSLAGWLELMASRTENGAGQAAVGGGQGDLQSVEGIAREMQRDMQRLNQIASRFSQIGSVPELRSGDVTEVVEETIAYFRSRGPQFGRHRFEARLEPVPPVPLNTELMGWALENLLKNSLDAVGVSEGVIEVCVGPHPDRQAVRVTVADNGRGIEAENQSRVFEPGFSTKKRGWGLGLAFVKRIVEEYHGGRIQLLHSEKGEGTTFEICLPVT